jgi:hypothetical protein
MKVKLYFGTLFLIFIYFGAFQEQIPVTNQEIVLEFVDTKIHKDDIKNTITEVKKKLLTVGVSNITIQETQEGTLKISYHSFVETADIKKALLAENQLILNENSGKEKKDTSTSSYNIDVYEITDESNISNLDDEYIFEIKVHSDRSTTNYSYTSYKNLEVHKANQHFKRAVKAHKQNPFTKDNTSCEEPEVRAGPFQHYI